jgi:hypothetical protein
MNLGRRDAGLRRLPFVAAAFVILVCVAILVLSGWREWLSRQAALDIAEVDVANLAQSLAQHAEDTLEMADYLVVGIANQLEADGTGPRALARLQSSMHLRKATLGRIRGLFVYDENGRWLATSENVDLTEFNNSDRDYFKHHQESSDGATLIGKPVVSRSGGQWVITLSRRFNRSAGSFATAGCTTSQLGH